MVGNHTKNAMAFMRVPTRKRAKLYKQSFHQELFVCQRCKSCIKWSSRSRPHKTLALECSGNKGSFARACCGARRLFLLRKWITRQQTHAKGGIKHSNLSIFKHLNETQPQKKVVGVSAALSPSFAVGYRKCAGHRRERSLPARQEDHFTNKITQHRQ